MKKHINLLYEIGQSISKMVATPCFLYDSPSIWLRADKYGVIIRFNRADFSVNITAQQATIPIECDEALITKLIDTLNSEREAMFEAYMAHLRIETYRLEQSRQQTLTNINPNTA
jgi:hypothetical protein